jgi:hypothetical protein
MKMAMTETKIVRAPSTKKSLEKESKGVSGERRRPSEERRREERGD